MKLSQANRGMAFERLVEMTNAQYRNKGVAIIQKVATPVKVMRMDKFGRIRDGWFEKKSTVDFIGTWNGRALAFDAKSTREHTRFDLKNVHQHQIDYLKAYQDQGAISFLLIEFAKKQEVYVLPFRRLNAWWEDAQNGGKKSIPHRWFLENCNLVKSQNGIILDYLKAVSNG